MPESTTPAFSGTGKLYDQLPKQDDHALSMQRERDCYVQGWRQFDNLSRYLHQPGYQMQKKR